MLTSHLYVCQNLTKFMHKEFNMTGVTWMYWLTIVSTSVTGLYVWQVLKRQQADKAKVALKPVPIERNRRPR